jgi:hypothetical protein
MSDQRFVRVLLSKEENYKPRYGPFWGLWDDSVFALVYTCSPNVGEWFDNNEGRLGLYESEVATMVNADETNTPSAAFVALAKRALLGEANDDD